MISRFACASLLLLSVLLIAGCVDGDDPDIVGVPTGTCEDVVERYQTLSNAHQDCQSAPDCVAVSSQLSCDCFWHEMVNARAETAALALLQEAEGCGISADSIFGCQFDVVPIVSVSCAGGRCAVSSSGSCLAP